ncbi:phosphoinositide 3-kinase regulatory subunit 4-like [Haliotis asinina]|uniref:phosphoinositide 3-kinase regulatory subunit 4-like n=1 Tax=Haliotis asinina TaxID=109174 RepID=UPI0035321423
MGNQLTGIAPSQILPVEQYLSDVPDYEFETNQGSTRFFKVARARCKEGLAIVKVFVIHDPSLPLSTHRDKLEEISQRLKGTSNCLPFQKAIQSEKAALLFRQYVKDSLYDRISTRPFLNSIEKKWIAFQMLCALNQCHKVKVCHGDIKSENIMITGWNWVLITDFASFKPTYLPEDNPSDFSYFFDTSRRRTCYIAPERFVESGLKNTDNAGQSGNIDLTSSEVKTGDLNPAMDIFSLGCVITELFTEGTSPFDLSQLLAYRSGEYSPWKILEKIEDPSIRELVRHMMQKDPNHRLSAEEYLIKQRGKAFPEYFYTYLKLYLQKFAVSPIIPADDRIHFISSDLPQSLKNLKIDETNVERNNALVLLISLVGSSSRDIHFYESRLTGLDLLLKLSKYVSADIILDRIIPYMLHFANDPFPRVRAKTIETITDCLSDIKNVPRSDSNVFPEYIFPNLTHLVHDEVALVRAAYAENIAHLAETALRVLEMTQLQELSEIDIKEDSEDSQYMLESSYDVELQTLQEMIQQKVVTLLSDPDNLVKQTLLQSGITRLCVFFGRQKANDVLLSHMITFLNDKYDWKLRGSFFENIVGVAAYVGWQSSSILKPLLEQGLSDPEEYVVHKALGAIKSLSELGLLQKPMLQEFVQEIVPFLAHPGIWIRQGAVGFVAAVARIMNIADLHCNLLPQVAPFLKQHVLQLDKEPIVLNALDEPIPRSVFDYVLRSTSIDAMFETLNNRKYIRSISRSGHRPGYPELEENLAQVFRKLTSLGMTETHETKLLAMKDFITKLHRSRAGSMENSASSNIEEGQRPGVLALQHVPYTGRFLTRRHADLHKPKEQTADGQTSPGTRRKKKVVHQDSSAAMNAEWKKMFGSSESEKSLSSSPKSKSGGDKYDLDKRSTSTLSSQSASSSMVNVSHVSSSGEAGLKRSTSQQPADKQSHQTRYASCKWDLRALVHKRREQYKVDVLTKDLLEGIAWDSRPPPDNWKPRGLLVAHLQEHRAAINRIQVCHDHSYFATCSNDGSVKLWECSRLEGKSVVNRSKHTLTKQGGRIKCLTFCEASHAVASASDNGTIHVNRITTDRVQPEEQINVDITKHGHVVDLTHFDTGAQSVLAYATVNGHLIGWDLRANRAVWELKNNPRDGLITSFAVNHTQCWLALGTSSGAQVCWDMRFQLPINTITHPANARVRKLIMHPKDQPWIVSAFQWNNEVSMWDVETGARQKSLWASAAPPLSISQNNNHAVHGMHIAATDTKLFLLTGGSDMRVRFWDLTYPANSFIMSHGAVDLPNVSYSYRSQLIDGTEVIQEVCTKKQANSDDIPRRVPEAPPTGHHDIISDVNICQSSQCLVITGSRDGVVKVWK